MREVISWTRKAQSMVKYGGNRERKCDKEHVIRVTSQWATGNWNSSVSVTLPMQAEAKRLTLSSKQ